METQSEQKLEGWAIVEVMGHSKFAGRISEQKIGIASLIRIDVPAVDGKEAFTKLIAPQALFAITPCDEQTARLAAEEFRVTPIYLYSAVQRPGIAQAETTDASAVLDDDEDEKELW